jgi:hypothetical protein
MEEGGEHRAIIESLFGEQHLRLDAAAEYDLRHEDHVMEMPQSGERIRGRDNMRAMQEAYPNPPDAVMRRITRETWALQETPMGALMVVWFECSDVEKVFAWLATDDSDYTTWFRARVLDVTRGDPAAPPAGPPPALLVAWPF